MDRRPGQRNPNMAVVIIRLNERYSKNYARTPQVIFFFVREKQRQHNLLFPRHETTTHFEKAKSYQLYKGTLKSNSLQLKQWVIYIKDNVNGGRNLSVQCSANGNCP